MTLNLTTCSLQDFRNLNLKKIGVVTDKNIAKMSPLSAALESLTSAGVDFEVFENVSIEPDNDRCDYDVTCTCNVFVGVNW